MEKTVVATMKKTYLETGRLNENALGKTIALSWHRCRLNGMHPSDLPSETYPKDAGSSFDALFKKSIDDLVPEHHHYLLLNSSMWVCARRTDDNIWKNLNSLDERYVGTTAAPLAGTYRRIISVSAHEHYLECFSSYYTVGMPILKEKTCVGVLMLVSGFEISQQDIQRIQFQLERYGTHFLKPTPKKETDLFSNLFLPQDIRGQVKQQLNGFFLTQGPILIQGDCESGKSTLAWACATREDSTPAYISSKTLPAHLERFYLETLFFNNQTVIVDNLLYFSSDALKFLLEYIEEKIYSSKSQKYSKYKGINIIVTTTYTPVEPAADSALKAEPALIFSKLFTRLQLRSVSLPNLRDMESDWALYITFLEDKYDVALPQKERTILMESLKTLSFKEAEDRVLRWRKTGCIRADDRETQSLHPLSQLEALHITKVLEHNKGNISASAHQLGITRATLYRKIKLYHIYTKTP